MNSVYLASVVLAICVVVAFVGEPSERPSPGVGVAQPFQLAIV